MYSILFVLIVILQDILKLHVCGSENHCLTAEREIQKSYWTEHSADLTVEAMMLDSKASDLDKEERPEVMILLFSLHLLIY